MDHDTIDQHNVVDRYLMGKLDPEEAARFEEHYFHCQRCLDQLELGRKLQRGFQQVATEEATVAVQQLGVLAWLVRLGRKRQALSLATLVLLLALPAGLMMRQIGHLGQQLNAARQPQTNTPILDLGPVRSATAEPSQSVRLPGDQGWLVLSLELDAIDFERYRVILIDDADTEIWRGEDLQPDHRDALAVSVHASSLPPGDYRFRVEAAADDGTTVPISRFAFRVLPDS